VESLAAPQRRYYNSLESPKSDELAPWRRAPRRYLVWFYDCASDYYFDLSTLLESETVLAHDTYSDGAIFLLE
jgi:hypothetical protein